MQSATDMPEVCPPMTPTELRMAQRAALLECELERAAGNLADLLGHCGTPGACEECACRVWRIRTLRGDAVAYDRDGLRHELRCRRRDRKKRKERNRG